MKCRSPKCEKQGRYGQFGKFCRAHYDQLRQAVADMDKPAFNRKKKFVEDDDDA